MSLFVLRFLSWILGTYLLSVLLRTAPARVSGCSHEHIIRLIQFRATCVGLLLRCLLAVCPGLHLPRETPQILFANSGRDTPQRLGEEERE